MNKVKLTPKEIVYKALELIEKHPKHWDQSTWHCDSSHCFMGFVDLIYNNFNIENYINRDTIQIERICRDALKISSVSFWILADTDNSLDDLKNFVNLCFGEIDSNSEIKKQAFNLDEYYLLLENNTTDHNAFMNITTDILCVHFNNIVLNTGVRYDIVNIYNHKKLKDIDLLENLLDSVDSDS